MRMIKFPEQRIKISFGALSYSISEQLRKQKIFLNFKDTEFIQELIHANNLLRIQGIISPSESNKANLRIMKRIAKLIKDENKLG